jgi:hypothetical protein
VESRKCTPWWLRTLQGMRISLNDGGGFNVPSPGSSVTGVGDAVTSNNFHWPLLIEVLCDVDRQQRPTVEVVLHVGHRGTAMA